MNNCHRDTESTEGATRRQWDGGRGATRPTAFDFLCVLCVSVANPSEVYT